MPSSRTRPGGRSGQIGDGADRRADRGGQIGDSSRIKNLHPARWNQRRNSPSKGVHADLTLLELILGRSVGGPDPVPTRNLLRGERPARPVVRGPGAAVHVVDTWISYKREVELEQVNLRPVPYEFYLYYDL